MRRVLVVDDDLNLLRVLRMRLEADGYAVLTAPDAQTALRLAEEGEAFDLALVDLKLAEANGIDLMEGLRRRRPRLPVIILTAYGTIETAVEAMKKGAWSYLTKPFDHAQLLAEIEGALAGRGGEREPEPPRRADDPFGPILGRSQAMRRVVELARRAALTDSNVYIQGESGTGKELLARAIHRASARGGGPLVAINCAAIPEGLLESELFGFTRGAFTGATHSKPGLFAQAHGGSLLLDEISEMPLGLQAKLLRAIEQREIHPLGAQRPVRVDVRIIATSNRDLRQEVQRGRFRADLFWRIHVIPLHLPPLRERPEDIPLLAEHFLRASAARMGRRLRGFTPEAMQRLLGYGWPGNVRELQNVIEYAVAMSTGEVVEAELLPLPPEEGRWKPLREAKGEFERQYVTRLMRITRGNVNLAARLAGKYRADLYRLLDKYGIRPEDFRQEGDEAPGRV